MVASVNTIIISVGRVTDKEHNKKGHGDRDQPSSPENRSLNRKEGEKKHELKKVRLIKNKLCI